MTDEAIVFQEKINRLKEMLGIKTDKALAEMLMINPKTFSRKQKNYEFPHTELLALKAQRPDLNIDLDYIYTGEPTNHYLKSIADAGASAFDSEYLDSLELSEEEKQLVRLFRIVGRAGKDAALNALEGMAYKQQHSPSRGILDEVRAMKKTEQAKIDSSIHHNHISNINQVIQVSQENNVLNFQNYNHIGESK